MLELRLNQSITTLDPENGRIYPISYNIVPTQTGFPHLNILRSSLRVGDSISIQTKLTDTKELYILIQALQILSLLPEAQFSKISLLLPNIPGKTSREKELIINMINGNLSRSQQLSVDVFDSGLSSGLSKYNVENVMWSDYDNSVLVNQAINNTPTVLVGIEGNYFNKIYNSTSYQRVINYLRFIKSYKSEDEFIPTFSSIDVEKHRIVLIVNTINNIQNYLSILTCLKKWGAKEIIIVASHSYLTNTKELEKFADHLIISNSDISLPPSDFVTEITDYIPIFKNYNKININNDEY